MRKRIVGAIICMVLIMSTFALAATTVNLGTENYRSKKYLVTKEQGDSYFMAEGLLVNTDGCLTTGKNRGSSVCWINVGVVLYNKYDGKTYSTYVQEKVTSGNSAVAKRARFAGSVYAKYTHTMSRFDCSLESQISSSTMTESFTFVNDQS